MLRTVAQAALESAGTTINQALERHVSERLGRAPLGGGNERVVGCLVLPAMWQPVRGYFSRNGYAERGLTLVIAQFGSPCHGLRAAVAAA